jgi:hypothetical protein
MQLHTIRAAGFAATVDAFAQAGKQLWFISMLGRQQSVRALWARLVKPVLSAATAAVEGGETAYLSEGDFDGGSPCWLAREAWGTWRFHGARLPSSAAYHGMLVPDLATYACERRDLRLRSGQASCCSLTPRTLRLRSGQAPRRRCTSCSSTAG